MARVGFGYLLLCEARTVEGRYDSELCRSLYLHFHVRSRAVQYLALGAGGPKLPEYSLLYVDIKADGTRSKTSWEPVDTEIQKDRDEMNFLFCAHVSLRCFVH